MNGRPISGGVWAAMVTPYTEDNQIDFHALKQMIDWYDRQGVDGLFSVCMSSEMHQLSLDERVALADFVVKNTPEHMNVVVSGHISQCLEEQIEELQAMAETNPDALVLVTNCIAGPDESDEVWKKNCQKILDALPGVALGLYECPVPYRRWLTPDLMEWCMETGRFVFMKEGSYELSGILPKLESAKDHNLKIFAAETVNLHSFMEAGASGYCGIYANMWPNLYTHLLKDKKSEEKAVFQQNFASLVSLMAKMAYPPCAKYYLSLEGIDIRLDSRTCNAKLLDEMDKQIVRQIHELWKSRALTDTLYG